MEQMSGKGQKVTTVTMDTYTQVTLYPWLNNEDDQKINKEIGENTMKNYSTKYSSKKTLFKSRGYWFKVIITVQNN